MILNPGCPLKSPGELKNILMARLNPDQINYTHGVGRKQQNFFRFPRQSQHAAKFTTTALDQPLNLHKNHLEFVKPQISGFSPQIFWSCRVGVGLRLCIFTKVWVTLPVWALAWDLRAKCALELRSSYVAFFFFLGGGVTWHWNNWELK